MLQSVLQYWVSLVILFSSSYYPNSELFSLSISLVILVFTISFMISFSSEEKMNSTRKCVELYSCIYDSYSLARVQLIWIWSLIYSDPPFRMMHVTYTHMPLDLVNKWHEFQLNFISIFNMNHKWKIQKSLRPYTYESFFMMTFHHDDMSYDQCPVPFIINDQLSSCLFILYLQNFHLPQRVHLNVARVAKRQILLHRSCHYIGRRVQWSYVSLTMRRMKYQWHLDGTWWQMMRQ